jgi:hypothetical protein
MHDSGRSRGPWDHAPPLKARELSFFLSFFRWFVHKLSNFLADIISFMSFHNLCNAITIQWIRTTRVALIGAESDAADMKNAIPLFDLLRLSLSVQNAVPLFIPLYHVFSAF